MLAIACNHAEGGMFFSPEIQLNQFGDIVAIVYDINSVKIVSLLHIPYSPCKVGIQF